MKNLKIRNKLFVIFGSLLALSLVISALSLSSIHRIQRETDTLVNTTLPNTSYIWEMRRNLVSTQRYCLMAFADHDPAQISAYLKNAVQDVEQNKALLEQCKQNKSLDQTKVQNIEALMAQEESSRNRMFALLYDGSETSAEQAFQIFEEEYKPLQTQQSDIMMSLRDDQTQFAEDRAAFSRKIYKISVIFGTVVSILLFFIGIFMLRKLMQYITIPLHRIQDATSALAAGDFSKELSYDSQDEFGETCRSIQTSFTELKRIIACVGDNFGLMAGGDISFFPDGNFPGEMNEIERTGGVLLDKLNLFLHEIKSSADQIRAGSDQVASGAQALAQGATEQASSIQELSASLNDVSDNVHTNAENSKKANQLAITSGKVAQSTLVNMQEMLDAMGKISTSSESIRKVIKVIDDITFQTNILSLNAAVEAARAGAAGKGFAVVADEVRNLAQKSSESAKEITALIESTIESVSEGEQIAQTTSQAFNELTQKIQNVVTTVNEIAEASQEQAEIIEQITLGVDQISAVVQTNSATSEESAAASEQLSSQANMLNDLVGQFKLRPENSSIPQHIVPEEVPTDGAVTYAPKSSSFDKY